MCVCVLVATENTRESEHESENEDETLLQFQLYDIGPDERLQLYSQTQII